MEKIVGQEQSKIIEEEIEEDKEEEELESKKDNSGIQRQMVAKRELQMHDDPKEQMLLERAYGFIKEYCDDENTFSPENI